MRGLIRGCFPIHLHRDQVHGVCRARDREGEGDTGAQWVAESALLGLALLGGALATKTGLGGIARFQHGQSSLTKSQPAAAIIGA